MLILTMANKREKRRSIARCEAEFGFNGRIQKGFTSNFSTDGLFIRSKNPFPKDTTLSIKLHLPNGGISSLTGIVAWIEKNTHRRLIGPLAKTAKKSGMGVRLLEKDNAYLQFVESRTS